MPYISQYELHNESVHCGMILCKIWKEHSKLPYTAATVTVGQARFLQPTQSICEIRFMPIYYILASVRSFE